MRVVPVATLTNVKCVSALGFNEHMHSRIKLHIVCTKYNIADIEIMWSCMIFGIVIIFHLRLIFLTLRAKLLVKLAVLIQLNMWYLHANFVSEQ